MPIRSAPRSGFRRSKCRQACSQPRACSASYLRSCLAKCFAITPNETELEFLTGIAPVDEKSCMRAAGWLLDRGVENVIVTLGAGLVVSGSPRPAAVCARSPQVMVVDTTAAGDVFNGALVTFLADGRDMANAIDLANFHAAALSTTRSGAQESAPMLAELKAFAPGSF